MWTNNPIQSVPDQIESKSTFQKHVSEDRFVKFGSGPQLSQLSPKVQRLKTWEDFSQVLFKNTCRNFPVLKVIMSKIHR